MKRELGRQPVELECGKEADNAVRHPPTRLSQAVVLGHVRIRKNVNPPRGADEDPFPVEPGEVNSWNSFGGKVFRSKDPLFAARAKSRSVGDVAMFLFVG